MKNVTIEIEDKFFSETKQIVFNLIPSYYYEMAENKIWVTLERRVLEVITEPLTDYPIDF